MLTRRMFAPRASNSVSARAPARGASWLMPSALLVASLFVATSCGAPGSSASSSDARARVLTLDELPPREREAWEAWQRGGAVWARERERARSDPALARFLIDNLVRTLVHSYDRATLATTGQKNGPFERASADLVELGEHSTPVLAELLDVRDGIVAFLAADLLVRIGARALPFAAAKLDDSEAETRRRAAELLGRLPHAGAEEVELETSLARLVQSDREWIVRAQAARALGMRAAQHDHKGFALGVLVRALADPDTAVVESASAGLEALGERRAVPLVARALMPAAQRGDLRAVRALQHALRALTQVQEDLTPEGWLDWYDRHPPPPLKALTPR